MSVQFVENDIGMDSSYW